MGTMRCPHCSSEIKKPGNVLAIILCIFGCLFVSGALFVIICLATITAIGRNANAEFDRVNATIEADAINDIGYPASNFEANTIRVID